jgi:hypothetical protein
MVNGPVGESLPVFKNNPTYYMNNSEAYMNSISNTFSKEPIFNCPKCNCELFTDWADNGFGPYSVQASPYGCECGWHETGCAECIKEKCFSWVKCQGRALIKVIPPAESPAINTMNNFDPKEGQQEAAGVAEEAKETANEQAAEGTQESAEEGNTEG